LAPSIKRCAASGIGRAVAAVSGVSARNASSTTRTLRPAHSPHHPSSHVAAYWLDKPWEEPSARKTYARIRERKSQMAGVNAWAKLHHWAGVKVHQ
jgi:hypothetical protein